MKLKKKFTLILFLSIVLSVTSLMFLNSESRNVSRPAMTKIEQEKLEHSVPAVDPAKVVKYMFEALLKLVPQSGI